MAQRYSVPTAEEIAAWRENGFVVTTFKKSLGRYTPRGKTVYATAEDALKVAMRQGDLAYVDYAHPYGLGRVSA